MVLTRRDGAASRDQILSAIELLSADNGYSPTIRQIAEKVGLSKSATYKHLCTLRDEEKVVSPPRSGAGWRLA